jgi:hypothetical protein
MDNIHYSEVTGIIRAYKTGLSFKNRDQFALVISVIWLSESHIQLMAAHGEMCRQQWLTILRMMFERNAHIVDMYRANGKKMPFGKIYSARSHLRFSGRPFYPIAALRKQLHSLLCALLSNKMTRP